MNDNVKRIYPEAKTALIDWIEKNFHQIEGYVATFKVSDGTTMTIYDGPWFDRMALAAITMANTQREDE